MLKIWYTEYWYDEYRVHNWKFFSRLTIGYDLIYLNNYKDNHMELIFFSNKYLSDKNIKDLVESGIEKVFPIGYEGDNRRLIYMKMIRANNINDLIDNIKMGKKE